MAADDEGDDEGRFTGPPAPDDRLWRHPSEVSGSGDLPSAIAVGPRVTPRRRSRGAAVLVAAGLAGAALMLVVLASTGSLGDSGDLRSAGSAGRVVTTVTPIALVERFHQGVLAVQADHHGAAITGSAVVLRTDGYLVTALVMATGADAIAVVLPDGRHLAATVVGNDVDHGLALLHVRAWHLQLPRVSSSAQVRPGDPAVAVGVATDGGSAIVTTGVVRGVGLRAVTGAANGRKVALGGLVGLDREYPGAADGGGLFGADGALVGLCMPAADSPHAPSSSSTLATTSIISTSTSTSGGAPGTSAASYAIPWSTVTQVTAGMLRRADAATDWLGARGRALTAAEAKRWNLDRAAVLTSVTAGSPAAAAGLRQGDVVLRIGGVRTSSLVDANRLTQQLDPGQPIVVAYLRDGRTTRATVAPDATTTTAVGGSS
jgi:S1-C subfamily serine protease